jgi:hypothetical protein
MQLLVVFLNAREHLEKLVSLLVEVGVTEATILDGQAVGHFLAHEVPIFAGLRQLVGEKQQPTGTVLALLENDSVFDELERLMKSEGIDFTEPGTGVIMTLPLSKVIRHLG